MRFNDFLNCTRFVSILIFLYVVMYASFVRSNEASDGQKESNIDPIVGGETVQDPTNSVYKDMAWESLKKYLQEVGSNEHHHVAVIKVTTQVVAGTLTRINFYAVKSTCQLGDDMEPINPPSSINPCLVAIPVKVMSCKSEIWEQPWLNQKDVTVRCVPI